MQIALLRHYLSQEEFQAWGWRVPFWISILLLMIAFKVRMALEETHVFLELTEQGQKKTESQLLNNFRDAEIRKRMFLLFLCVSSSGVILFFCVQVYASIFLKTTVQISTALADQLSIYATLALLPLTISAGWLSDKLGRKPVVISGLIFGALLTLPAFDLLEKIGVNAKDGNNLSVILLGIILIGLSAILALVVDPQTALLAELLPARSRNSAATLPHNLAAGWIGGLLPLIVTWINQHWDSSVAGLWYPTIFLAISATIAIKYLPETQIEKT
ncbi:MFS transporter [Polynucleobacter necessarius]|uniref:MFS transporter n=1 Tax=Polynucleobacter necessarius TaxID=576610 RepID=UPI0018D50D24|nr:MFS transporter [Polynucleobacter necessarius]